MDPTQQWNQVRAQLGNFVRNYVHYDNLAGSFSKQAQNARKVKDEFETRIIGLLETNNMEKTVIQIVGGRLTVVEEKRTNPLNIGRIEEMLHEYYKAKGSSDETANIMRFLRNERGTTLQKKLKRHSEEKEVPPAAPPAPAAPLP